ncbi:MAG: flap endonuclease-1 [Candidatus Diapherotrites archaeon]|nr:flap endonuclease-1 [Candidatus Diapherotrites archaeon]
MGVNLGQLVSKKEIEMSDLQGKKIGIDSYNVLYQFLSSIRSRDGQPLMDSKGKVTSHITGLLYRTVNLLEAGVKPVFAFDGKHHELKAKTIQERIKIRTDAGIKLEKARTDGDLEGIRKYSQQSMRLTEEMVNEAKKLVEYMGLPVVQAKSEGEAQLAVMCAQGEIFGVGSQDYDSLLFGAPFLIKNLTVTGRKKLPNKNVYIDVKTELIGLPDTLKSLNISREKLIWLALLLGTDFNEKFPNIGPKKALKLVQENNSFEEIIKKTEFEPEFDWKEVENIFLNPDYNLDYKIQFKEPDTERLIDFLCGQHDFSEERVKNAINKITAKAQEKGNQTALSQWG